MTVTTKSSIHLDEDDDDPYAGCFDEKDSADEYEDDDEANVDLDMLPTMLVYRGGELVYNWMRLGSGRSRCRGVVG
jgi:hypothetical protein